MRGGISRITCSRSSSADERPALDEFIARAADAAEMFAVDGIDKVMNVYNPEATAPEQPIDSLLPDGGREMGKGKRGEGRQRRAVSVPLSPSPFAIESVQKETYEQEVRARVRRVARCDRGAGDRSAHAGRGHRPAHGRPDREDRELGPAQARLRNRPAQGRHLRAGGHHRHGRAHEGNRSPPEGVRHRHPPSRRPRGRGAGRDRTDALPAHRDVAPPPRRARPAARPAAWRRPARRERRRPRRSLRHGAEDMR